LSFSNAPRHKSAPIALAALPCNGSDPAAGTVHGVFRAKGKHRDCVISWRQRLVEIGCGQRERLRRKWTARKHINRWIDGVGVELEWKLLIEHMRHRGFQELLLCGAKNCSADSWAKREAAAAKAASKPVWAAGVQGGAFLSAYLLDPQTRWRSCAITFIESGDYKRAETFTRMEQADEWDRATNIEIFIREGKPDWAMKTGAPEIPHWGSYKMLLACAQHRPDAEIAALVPGAEIDDDPESTYLFAGHLSYCGQTEKALRFLVSAVQAHYCSYPAMDTDPMLANIRGNPKFREVREAGIRCQTEFDAQRGAAVQ
jgi:hypothetical protein